jgi:hypothetical protein
MKITTLNQDACKIKQLITNKNNKELKRLNDIYQESYKLKILTSKILDPIDKQEWACIIGINIFTFV